MTALSYLIYVGLAVSIGVYGWRLYRRYVHHETREDRAAARREAKGLDPLPPKPGKKAKDTAADTTAAPAAGATPSGRMTTRERKAAERAAQGKPSVYDLVDDVPRPDALPDPDDLPEGTSNLVQAVIKEELEARKRAEGGGAAAPAPAAEPATSTRGGVFAKADVPAPPVSELLEGIKMPCDLSPWVGGGTTIDPYHVAFITNGYTVEAVGAGVADELERLGFVLTTESDTELLATRKGERLRVTVHADAKSAQDGGSLLFPTAPGGSIAVVFDS